MMFTPGMPWAKNISLFFFFSFLLLSPSLAFFFVSYFPRRIELERLAYLFGSISSAQIDWLLLLLHSWLAGWLAGGTGIIWLLGGNNSMPVNSTMDGIF